MISFLLLMLVVAVPVCDYYIPEFQKYVPLANIIVALLNIGYHFYFSNNFTFGMVWVVLLVVEVIILMFRK